MEKDLLTRRRDTAYARSLIRRERAARDLIIARTMLYTPPPLSRLILVARVDCALMDEYPLEIDDDELLVGRFCSPPTLTDEQKALLDEYDTYKKRLGSLGGYYKSSTGHRVVDYAKLLRMGTSGILSQLAAYESAITPSDPQASEKRAFYQSVQMELEAFVRISKRYCALLSERVDRETNPERARELRRMAECLAHAPEHPCKHFDEALQVMWLAQFVYALTDDYSLSGRCDQYLYPYYERDVQQGLLDERHALSLIEEFYFKNNEIYGNWSVSLMVGGVDEQGAPVWNALSELFLDAIGTTGLVNPSVAVAYTRNIPDTALRKCVRLLADGLARPAFFNDGLITRGLRRAGLPDKYAQAYIHSNCVEITPVGASNAQVATPYINLAALFDDVLKDADAYTEFDEFYRAYVAAARALIDQELSKTCNMLAAKTRYAVAPLTSALTDDCLARGVDVGCGGALFNACYPCFPGFVTAVDSLCAVKTAVYDRRELTFDELRRALADDFVHDPYIQGRLSLRCPKFGNGDCEADALAEKLHAVIVEELKRFRTPLGGAFYPSYFAWMRHGRMGKVTGATPDGRGAHTALSECLGPSCGNDREGPLGVLRSVMRIDQTDCIGGVATNLRFSRDFLLRKKGAEAFILYLRAFMDNGGFELQVNVVSQQALLDAKRHPEQYRTLMVRVAGFSDYFVALDPEIQDEIIKRTEHGEMGA